MRRIQIYLDEAVDEALQSEAARTGRSKASLIRECVAGRYGRPAVAEVDPLDRLIGAFDVEPAPVDEVVYGPAAQGPKSGTQKSRASSAGKGKARGEAR